jgi:hypothetical protein
MIVPALLKLGQGMFGKEEDIEHLLTVYFYCDLNSESCSSEYAKTAVDMKRLFHGNLFT